MSSRSRASKLAILSLLGAASAHFQPTWTHPTSAWTHPTPSWTSWPAGSCNQTEYTTPTFKFGNFSYPTMPPPSTTVTSNAVTASPVTTYAASYAAVSSLFANISTTSWPNWTPVSPSTASPSVTASGYDDEAYTLLWQSANPTNFSRGIYSTTASPTTVPSSALQAPPNLYFSPETCYQFPKDFVFAAAGSASQCEGAVADQGKSPSFMDMLFTIFSIIGTSGGAGALVSVPGQTSVESNYVALEHYYLYKQDIDRMAAMGLKYYSFSIAWTRILPFALPGTPVNEYGIQHYDDVINYALEQGLVPIATITHFDTPLQFFGGGGANYLSSLAASLKNETYGIGGITFGYNNETFTEAYVNYAKIVLSHYADRVPYWVTFNEPQIGASNGPAVANVLKAHAQAYHFYKEELKGTGKVSMKMGITPSVPLDATNASDVEAANWFNDLYVGALLNPLALGEDYPEAYKLSVADYVPLSAEDLEYMNNTIDYVSIDGYSAPVISAAVSNYTACALNATSPAHVFPFCVAAASTLPSGWIPGYSPFGSATDLMFPSGLRTQLNYCYSTFKKPVLVSEFGLSLPAPPGGILGDNLFNQPQSEYLLSYLNEMLKAIWEDGVDVLGAIVWNWADDWEFGSYAPGFGLQFNNRTTQTRVYRRSFFDVIGFVEGNRASE